jgi:elongation factor P
MISTSEFKRGVRISLEGEPFSILEVQVQSPSARGAATLVKVKLRSLVTGQFRDRTFKGGDKVEEANVELRRVQYLYADGDTYHFMDTESFDQFELSATDLGAAAQYLKEGIGDLRSVVLDGRAVSIELPHTVSLRVIETPPPLKGATAQAQTKPATLETGLVINVPTYIETEETIVVDTRDGRFVSRAKG